ncbi:hypothetical protein EV127DRAFT_516271 [Xylaria flabelliformis]|nr:hypothetical protein EV127DRAFT_516271 [Xylaria flabelliformis]
MAAPTSKTIGNLNGKWKLNKGFSDDTDPALSIQGIGWVARKVIKTSTVTLDVNQYTDEKGTVHIAITQEASGVASSQTHEHRTLDFQERELTDKLFGKVKGQSKFVSAKHLAAAVQENGISDDGFLSAGWISDDAEKTGPDGTSHVFTHVHSAEDGWTGTQVWGFQMVNGKRRYVRNIVVAKGDESHRFRMIYDWISE